MSELTDEEYREIHCKYCDRNVRTVRRICIGCDEIEGNCECDPINIGA